MSYIETATDSFEFDNDAFPNEYWAMSKVYKKGFINKIIVECGNSYDNSSILIANASNHNIYNQYTFNAIEGVNEIAINKYIEYDFYVFVLAPTKFTQKIGKYKSSIYNTTLSFIYDNQFAISVDRRGVYGELDTIRDDMVLANDDNNGSYVIKDNSKNIVVVDCLGNGDFTNIKSACESITNSNINNQYEIVVRPGTYNENYIIVPNFTHIHGIKPNTVIVTSEGISGTNAVFDQRDYSSKLSNMHIKSQTGYCIHYDNALDRKVIKNENLILELLPNREATNNSIIGGGSFLYGTYVEWKNCTFINGTVSCHTNQFKYENFRDVFTNCKFVNSYFTIGNVGGYGDCIFEINNCVMPKDGANLACFTNDILDVDNPSLYLAQELEWQIVGYGNKNLVPYFATQSEGLMFETKENNKQISVSGSAVKDLFGTVRIRKGNDKLKGRAYNL